MVDDVRGTDGHRVQIERRGSPLELLVAAFATVIVVSNIAASKPVEIGYGEFALGPIQLWPLILDGGAVLFPLAYVLGDVLAEVYGFRAARRAVVVGLVASALASVTFYVVIQLPPMTGQEDHAAAFAEALGPLPQIVLASLVAFGAGQLANAAVLVRMRDGLRRGGLVGRLMTSSVAGQTVDTFLFCSIAASAIGITGFGSFLNYFAVGVAFKLAIETACLPVTIRLIARIRRHERTLPGLAGHRHSA